MAALVRTELLKLTSIRTPWFLAAATIGLACASALVSIVGAGQRQAPSIGTTGAARGLLAGFGHGALIAMLFGSLAAATEYRHRTITGTLLRSPRRVRVAIAKAVAVLLVTTAVGLLGLLVCVAAGVAARAVTPDTLGPHLALHGLGLVLTYPAYGSLGLGIGLLLPRFHALTAVLPAAWVLVLEDLVFGSFTRHVPPWAISRVSAAAADAMDVTPLLPVWAGVAGLGAYALAGWAAGTGRLVRSDIH